MIKTNGVQEMTANKWKSYTLEFKQSSAKLALEPGKSVAQTARDLGINVNTLHGWIKNTRTELHRSKPIKKPFMMN